MRGGGDRPGEYTISHAPLHPANGNGHDEESEAPSSPTMTEVPLKSHTMPAPGSNPIDSDRHVAFAPLEVNGLDSSPNGNFMDATPKQTPQAPKIITESPTDTTKPFISRGLTASPASASIRIPESPIGKAPGQSSPILKPSSGPSMAGLGHSPLAAHPPAQASGVDAFPSTLANGDTASEPHIAFSGIPPAKTDKSLAERVADRTVMEELHAESLESANTDQAEGSAAAASAIPAAMRTGDKSETATLDGLPLSAVGPGGVLGSMESEVPEGKGTKRLYKMSKMFSKLFPLSMSEQSRCDTTTI